MRYLVSLCLREPDIQVYDRYSDGQPHLYFVNPSALPLNSKPRFLWFEQSGEISFLSLIKIAAALDLIGELEHSFENIPPSSIEEIICGQD